VPVPVPVPVPVSVLGGGEPRGGARAASPLALARFERLIARSGGSAGVSIGLLDGPVVTTHPDLAGARIRTVEDGSVASCTLPESGACAHGTFIAGILVARRGARAPAICPGCALLLRPIFRETHAGGRVPTATPDDVAQAIADCVGAGGRVLNLSAATVEPSTRVERRLHEALDYASARGTLVVAAAGNQATLGSSAITRHPWVIPVVACDRWGRPTGESNLGGSVGRRGLGAPGEAIESLAPGGGSRSGGGTSVAAAFVTGAVALLWSLFPAASAGEIKRAVSGAGRRRGVTPPLLDAEAALAILVARFGGG
jgi:subtilisin family serine protease